MKPAFPSESVAETKNNADGQILIYCTLTTKHTSFGGFRARTCSILAVVFVLYLFDYQYVSFFILKVEHNVTYEAAM